MALWDVVAFDEAAGIRFSDKNGLNIMKGYMEDGTFSRGRDIINAEGSIVFVGNIYTDHFGRRVPRRLSRFSSLSSPACYPSRSKIRRSYSAR